MPIDMRANFPAACAVACTLLLGSCDGGLRTDVDPAGYVAGRESVIEDPAEIAEIAARLSAREPHERADAARTLRRVRPFEPVEPGLIAALSDPQADVRLAAVETLTRPVRSDAVADPLLAAFNDPDPRVAAAAALAVRDFREQAASALTMALNEIREGGTARRRSAEQIQFLWPALDDAAFGTVVGLLDDPDTRIRAIAALTISKALVVRRAVGIDPRTEALVASLTSALSDDHAEVRRDAAIALEALGGAAASSWPVIEAVLRTEPDREAGLALEMAARSVDAAGRGSLSQVGTTIWTDAGLCIPDSDAAIAGLKPLDPEGALAGLGRDRIALSAREAWAVTGQYAVMRHHYSTFAVDIAGGLVERIASQDPSEGTRNGLHAGLTREEVYGILDIKPTPRADEAGLFRIRTCDVQLTGVAVELEFDAFDTVSEISVVVPAL